MSSLIYSFFLSCFAFFLLLLDNLILSKTTRPLGRQWRREAVEEGKKEGETE
jgi:hypothetical protein